MNLVYTTPNIYKQIFKLHELVHTPSVSSKKQSIISIKYKEIQIPYTVFEFLFEIPCLFVIISQAIQKKHSVIQWTDMVLWNSLELVYFSWQLKTLERQLTFVLNFIFSTTVKSSLLYFSDFVLMCALKFQY